MWSRRTVHRVGAVVAVAAALLTARAQLTEGRAGADEVVLDAFSATAYEVGQLHRTGAVPVCQVRMAVWEPHRPDAVRFPDSVLGSAVSGGGRWLDVRAWDDLAPVLSDRLRLCREKGFDVVRLADPVARPQPAGSGVSAADWRQFDERVYAVARDHGLTVSRG